MRWVGYQQRWLNDRSRMRAVVKSRRIGFSEVAAWRRAVRALGFGWLLGLPVPAYPQAGKAPIVTHKPVAQNIVSASERQALEFLSKVKVHLEALAWSAWGTSAIVHSNAHQIELYDGTKLRAFAPNPRTIRGDGGDLTFDECGAIPRARAVWTAAKALADPTLRDRDGFEIDFIGTPEGDNSFFYDVMHDNDKFGHVNRHTVTIHDAIADTFPLKDTVEALRAECGDEDTWLQEYCCTFLSSAMRYIPDTLWDASTVDANEVPAFAEHASRFGGFDIGRRQDASAYAELVHHGDKLWQDGLVETERGMAFDLQEAWMDEKISRLLRINVDATGMGEAPAERLVTKHGEIRVEPVRFTTQSKELLATSMKLMLNRRILKPRRDDIDLRREVLLMRRTTTEAGVVRFDIERTKGAHGDRAWALALACNASGLATKRTEPLTRDALMPHDPPPQQPRDVFPDVRPNMQPLPGYGPGARPVERGRRRAWE